MTEYTNNIYTHITGLKPNFKMMKFTHNDWGQREIMKNIIISTKRGTDNIYLHSDVIINIPKKKLKYAKVMAKLNKPP